LLACASAATVLAPMLEALSRELTANEPPQHTVALGADSDDTPPMDAALTDALLQGIPVGFDLRNYLEGLEQQLIVRALDSAGGTVAAAARLLGLRRTTLVEKLRKYSLMGTDGAVSES
jgi:sigma-54 specific flagellar transcriptional regulator A